MCVIPSKSFVSNRLGTNSSQLSLNAVPAIQGSASKRMPLLSITNEAWFTHKISIAPPRRMLPSRLSHTGDIRSVVSHRDSLSFSDKNACRVQGASPLLYDNCLPRVERHGFYFQWTEVFVGPKTRPYC